MLVWLTGRTVYKQADRLVTRMHDSTTKLNECYWQPSRSRPSSMREPSYTRLFTAYLGSSGNDSRSITITDQDRVRLVRKDWYKMSSDSDILQKWLHTDSSFTLALARGSSMTIDLQAIQRERQLESAMSSSLHCYTYADLLLLLFHGPSGLVVRTSDSDAQIIRLVIGIGPIITFLASIGIGKFLLITPPINT